MNIGRYELVKEIGSGGYSTIFEAVDTELKREVAVKVLRPALMADEEFVVRFKREAHTAARLNHPNIVDIYDVGEENGRLYIVMKRMTKSLKERIAEKPLSLEETKTLMRQVAAGLDYAHAQNLIHRDLKPANVLIDDETGQAVLSDFGIVKALEGSSSRATFTGTGGIIGTPEYTAPEIWDDALPSKASDIYALGATAYECLVGEQLYKGNTISSIIAKHQRGPEIEKWPDTWGDDVQTALAKAMACDPKERYPSAMAFVEGLETSAPQIIEKAEETPVKVTPQKVEEKREKSGIKLAWIAPILLVLILGGWGLTQLRGGGGNQGSSGSIAENPPETASSLLANAETPTATNTPDPTKPPLPTQTPTSADTATPIVITQVVVEEVVVEVTSTPEPTTEPSEPPTTLTETDEPEPTLKPSEIPAPTNTPRPQPTNTTAPKRVSVQPTSRPAPTATPRPQPTGTNTPRPIPTPTRTPNWNATSTVKAQQTMNARPTSTNTPRPTNTPNFNATSTVSAQRTINARPTWTNTPRPTITPNWSATSTVRVQQTIEARASSTPTLASTQEMSSTLEPQNNSSSNVGLDYFFVADPSKDHPRYLPLYFRFTNLQVGDKLLWKFYITDSNGIIDNRFSEPEWKSTELRQSYFENGYGLYNIIWVEDAFCSNRFETYYILIRLRLGNSLDDSIPLYSGTHGWTKSWCY